MHISIAEFSASSCDKLFVLNNVEYNKVVCCSNPNRIMFCNNNGEKKYIENVVDIMIGVDKIDSSNVSEIYIVCENIFSKAHESFRVTVL